MRTFSCDYRLVLGADGFLRARVANAAWPSIKSSVNSFWVPQANGRKIYFTEVRLLPFVDAHIYTLSDSHLLPPF